MQTTMTNEKGEPQVRSGAVLCRAVNPREGDWLECDGNRVDVKAVADGQVWYDVTTVKDGLLNMQMDLEEWPRTVLNAIEKGAKFHAA